MNPSLQEYYYYYPQQEYDHTLTTVPNNPSTITTNPAEASRKLKKKKKDGGSRVRLSTDPQSVAARERRHRISHRLKTLQSMVPGAAKMDTVSLLDHAIHYVHFLNSQIRLHQFFLLSSQMPPPPLTVPDPLLLLPPSTLSPPDEHGDGCCFGAVDAGDLTPWPGVAGSFEGEACYCSGGSTSTLNF